MADRILRDYEDEQSDRGKTDLLLRFFDSEFFNEWIAVQYLYTSNSTGVHDYICNRLYTLSESAIEKYLIQMCTLVVERRGAALERCIVDLCSRSLRLACKVCWYMIAASEDKPNRPDLAILREKCETAAIQGELGSLKPKDDVLDVPDGAGEQRGEVGTSTPEASCTDEPLLAHLHGANDHSRSHVSPMHIAPRSPVSIDSQQLIHKGRARSNSQTQTSVESPRDLSLARSRKSTFRSTMDVVVKLTAASDSLVGVFPIEERAKVLRARLHEINTLLERLPAHATVLFPMGKSGSRVVRLPLDETTLLNSRDKAPYMLLFEVIAPEGQDEEESPKPAPNNALPSLSALLGEDDGRPRTFSTESSFSGVDDMDTNPLDMALDALDPPPERPPEIEQPATDPDPASPCPPGTPPKDIPPLSIARSSSAQLIGSPKATSSLGALHPAKSASAASISSLANQAEPAAYFSASSPPDSIARAIDAAMAGLRDRKLVRSRLLVQEDGSVRVVIWPVGAKRAQSASVGSENELAALSAKPPTHANPRLAAAAPLRNGSARRAPVPINNRPLSKSHKSLSHNALDKKGQRVGITAAEHRRNVFGERWEVRTARIREQSPYGAHPRWKLHNAIVKTGDDCRQEHLAAQLLSTFKSIFSEAGLPLWIRPFEVLPTSSNSAIIETIPNAMSIHAVKARSPPGFSLRDHFSLLYTEGSPAFKTAQRNFVESAAAYSVVSYLLQVKDRHNGNIMLDDRGHMIHIDFGFMLSNSPGAFNFENAPFKLTQELLEVMDSDAEGTGSELFDYFKVLCIQGFLAARKHADRIICLIEMMQHSGCPCFKGGPKTMERIRKRFAPGRPEEACVEIVLGLISDSLDSWRTRQYDYYQRVLNGIL